MTPTTRLIVKMAGIASLETLCMIVFAFAVGSVVYADPIRVVKVFQPEELSELQRLAFWFFWTWILHLAFLSSQGSQAIPLIQRFWRSVLSGALAIALVEIAKLSFKLSGLGYELALCFISAVAYELAKDRVVGWLDSLRGGGQSGTDKK